MLERFYRMLSSMPDVEQRRKSFFFEKLANALGMVPENDLHWIVYATFRSSLFVLLSFSAFVVFRLSMVQTLTPDIVKSGLQIYSVGSSLIIFLFITPYYVAKAKKLVGFSKIDYMEVFSKSPPRFGWTLKRAGILKKTKFLFIVTPLVFIFGWVGILTVLAHYNSTLSIGYISVVILIFSFLYGFFSFAPLVLIMVYLQYKYHYDEIPNNKTLTERKL